MKIQISPVGQLFTFSLRNLLGLRLLAAAFIVIKPNKLGRQRDQYDSRPNFLRQSPDLISQEVHATNERAVMGMVGNFA